MPASLPIPYFVLMILAGAGLSLAVHNNPALATAAGSPMIWLLGLALVYELIQKLIPALRLAALTPMQRFSGFFAGAMLYFLLMRFA